MAPSILAKPGTVAAVLVAMAIVTTPARASSDPGATAQPPTAEPLPESWDGVAQQLMQAGQLERAAALLEARLAIAPKDVQARFLTGMVALAGKDNPRAIRIFRGILIDQPKATRVRLELARAFYFARDYGNAMRQFQFAVAGNPPPAVLANIKHYMAAIRDAKSISYNFGVAVAPDTNLNTGSSAREVTLFGLPFDLSDEARRRSGVGLALEAGGEWAPAIGTGKRLRIGLSGQRREYSGSGFDDMTAAAYAGPRIVLGKLDLSLLGTGYKRWYGAHPYNWAAGARAEATYYLTPRLALSAAAVAQRIRFRRERDKDGPLMSLNGGAFYALTSSSGITFKTGVTRQAARIAPYSSWSGFVAAGYFRDLPMGFSVYVEPSYSRARYDEALLGFGRRRLDTTKSVLLTVLNRRIVLSRFTPRISYTWTRQNSSIALYQFTKSRLEIGLTTVF